MKGEWNKSQSNRPQTPSGSHQYPGELCCENSPENAAGAASIQTEKESTRETELLQEQRVRVGEIKAMGVNRTVHRLITHFFPRLGSFHSLNKPWLGLTVGYVLTIVELLEYPTNKCSPAEFGYGGTQWNYLSSTWLLI